MKLKGKVAIVTGGGQGIGRGIVQCLAEEGADIAIFTKTGDSCLQAAEELKETGCRSLPLKTDVTNREQVSRSIKATVDFFGKIDILVNSVGGGSIAIAPFVDLEEWVWDRNYELNIKSQVFMCQAVAPYFIKQKSGKILNLSSIGGKRAAAMNAPYGATKAGVIYFTKALAAELADCNINVNCICPAAVFTPTFAKLIDDHMIRPEAKAKGMTARQFFDKVLMRAYPMNREITPEDIGRAAVFLVSEDARNITGQTLNITAGASIDID
ncbi:MAG: SDR family oxidoreductase [Syntrophales bacterium]|jgi:NAD(P)-dependent dehydrogenase (short-subunit alcohol dehydrogenase family)|nr:SDR family oxidoreductase [Syntrophales bacterium]MDY0044823.1 SDR family oxidoreductase [Syntrophales bacterium]